MLFLSKCDAFLGQSRIVTAQIPVSHFSLVIRSCNLHPIVPSCGRRPSGGDPEVDANGAVNTENGFFQQSGSNWDITLDTSLLNQARRDMEGPEQDLGFEKS